MSIGERLKGARVRAGMSLRDLAEMVDVSAQAVSKYERDLDVPSSGVLLRLAKSLGVQVEYLLRPINISISQPCYRKRKRLKTKNQQIINSQLVDWLERYMSIEILLSCQIEYKTPSIDRKIIDIEDVEKVALALRQEWRLGLDKIDNLSEMLEDRGIKIGVVPGFDDFDALTIFVNNTNPVIVVKDDVPGDRQRFNIAHELGHIILDVPTDWDEELIEKASHRFAGAFLAPAEAVYKELGHHRYKLDPYELHLLKHKYGMSMQAWIYRAKDLGIISAPSATNLFKIFRVNNWYREEPGDMYPPEKLDRLDRLIVRALAEDIISDSKASELLGKSLPDYWRVLSEQHDGFPLPVYR